jgi:hypothetical protein
MNLKDRIIAMLIQEQRTQIFLHWFTFTRHGQDQAVPLVGLN